MIDPKKKTDEKLPAAREMFEDANQAYQRCNAERHRCARNYHNTGGSGQWDDRDKQILEEESRPALTFDLIKRYIDTSIGMHMDMKRRAVARPVGAEDRFGAEVIEALCDRIDAECGTELADAEVMLNAYVMGEGDGYCDVGRDKRGPNWIKFHHYSACPYDVIWDPGSSRHDRSDATYVCYSRWLGKTEFKLEYPDHAKEWESIVQNFSASPGWPDVLGQQNVPNQQDGNPMRREDYDQGNIYYDKYKNRARVIQIVYSAPFKQLYASAPGRGEAIPVSADERDMMMQSWEFEGVEFSPEWDEKIHAIEFVGTKVLYDSTQDDAPYQPFDGFPMVPFLHSLDSEDNCPYSPIRNAIDAQGRINKAFSVMLEHLMSQKKSGYIAEEDALGDQAAFEEAISQPGTVALAKPGALTANKIIERTPPQADPVAQQQMDMSIEMIERVFGLGNELIQPAAQQEAATTVAIRYHKSQLSLADVRRAFDHYQREIKRRKIETILRAMPDDQIAALLGNDNRFRVQNRVVYEVAPDPRVPGQIQVVNQIDLNKLRKLNYDIELESTTGNTTLRMLDLQKYMEASAAGFPVDPMLLADKMADSRSEREQLRAYVQQSMQMAAQKEQLQMQQLQAAIGKQLQIEEGKVLEQRRHNIADEQLRLEKQIGDQTVDFLDVLQKEEASGEKALADRYKAELAAAASRQRAAIGQGGTQ